MKVSVLKNTWLGKLLSGAYFYIAYNNKSYKINALDLLLSAEQGDGSGTDITDYCYDIVETPDGINKIFTLRYDYVVRSTHVYLGTTDHIQGLRQTLDDGSEQYDYKEIGNKQIEFFTAPIEGARIVVDYKSVDDLTQIFTSEFSNIFQ